jgi:hypothetical protein
MSVGCGASPTAVLATITLPSGAAPPSMNAIVFDRFGVIGAEAISHPGAGTLLVRGLADEAQRIRVVVQAGGLLGGAAVDTVPHQTVPVTVALAADTPDRDGDGIPDDVDDCPDTPDPAQTSSAGDGVGDACRGADLSMPADAADAGVVDGSPVVLFDDEFNDAGLPNWTRSTSGLAAISVSNGYLQLSLPPAANATADVSTIPTFGPGTSVHMSVTLTAGQVFDHHGLGYANAAVSSNCGLGETEAAMFRGQDTDRYVETELGGSYTCDSFQSSYPAGTRMLDIVRGATSVDFYENGTLVRSETTTLSSSALPIHLSAYTFTSAPALPILIRVDYVRVTQP